jgi:hypothetical protein
VPGRFGSCANQGWCEWRVAHDAEGVVVLNDVRGGREDPLPVQAKRERPRSWDSPARGRYVAPVEDGWIVGAHWGELGAGLWWVSRDGTRHTRLSDLAVIDLIPMKRGVLAPTRLNDDGWHGRGSVLLLSRARNGRFSAKQLAQVGTSASAAMKESDDAILLATETQLVRVTLAGEKTILHTGRWNEVTTFVDQESQRPLGLSFIPRSVTASANGDVYIGTTAAIVRLSPEGSRYHEEWLTPRCPVR